MRLSGENREEGYSVYRIRETAFGGGTKLSAEDGFLQFMIERLFASSAPSETEEEEETEEGDDMKLTSLQSITDFMTCAGKTLPDHIRLWARRNLAVAKSHEVSPEERRHAQRALSIMMNVRWKHDYFEAIDPVEARRILDEELYGMERVKQRIIETIIQINRTHTLPAYGLLLVGPAGTGKSQIAYAVARILKLPWTTLDMSSINDPEQLTGSSRVYANAKRELSWRHFPWQESPILYLSSMNWTKRLPEKEMEIRQMSAFNPALTIWALRITTWNVWCLPQAYIPLPQLTIRSRSAHH